MGRKTADQGQKRKKKDPGAPKRPTTAFFYFVKHCRDENLIKADRVSEFTKACAEKWKKMNDDDRVNYDNAAKKDRARYDEEMAIFKPVKDPGKPKKSQTAFLLFVASMRPKLKEQGLPNKDILVKAGELWRGLDETEKEPFEDQAKVAKQKYLEDMERYNSKQSGASPAKKVKKVEPANGADDSDESEDESAEESD
ncbi:high mobility group protein B3-like [Tubulanus polymorphus]|uniref:high mobility group protein B3-like n=1 Tax=Tubulanus polymorphus TaxID=672921 RepID=UPI003DA28296